MITPSLCSAFYGGDVNRALAFPATAARVWNALPSSVHSAPSLLQFRRDLKRALHVSAIVLFTIVSSCVTDCNF